MKKFGIFLIFSLIPFVGLNSIPTVFANHGGLIGQCDFGQFWDPNSQQCVPDDQCPFGVYPPLGAPPNQQARHCALPPMMAVGGELIPLDATAVLIAGIQTNALSVLSAFVVIGAIAFGALVISVKRKQN